MSGSHFVLSLPSRGIDFRGEVIPVVWIVSLSLSFF